MKLSLKLRDFVTFRLPENLIGEVISLKNKNKGIDMSFCKRFSRYSLFSVLLGTCIFLTSFVHAISIKSYHGKEIAPYAKELSSFFLKMYQDHLCYFSEQEWDGYIASYVNTDESIVSIAFSDERIVGAALGKPLAKASEKYRKPFFNNSEYLNSLFYLGDLKVKPEYKKFSLKEKLYREFEVKVIQMDRYTGICLWQTQACDPVFSAAFLGKQGFSHHPEFHFEELYKDTPSAEISAHYMTSWIKKL
jgi:hypothetical protein